jgi:hypothetical protein
MRQHLRAVAIWAILAAKEGAMRRLVVGAGLGAAIILSGCSPKAAIDKLAGPEGKATAFELLDQLCAPDQTPLVARFHPDLTANSAEQLKMVGQYCPQTNGERQLVGYHTSANVSTEGSVSTRSMVVVQRDGARWITASFTLQARDGARDQVMEWNINASPEKPSELATLDAVEDAMPMVRLVALGLVLLLGGLITWLVMRSRRKRQESRG